MSTKIFIGFIGMLCIIGTMFTTVPKGEVVQPIVPETVEIKLEQPEFFLEDKPTCELVLKACEYYDINNPQIVTAQAILETGHYRSENCVKGNNLFGLYDSKNKRYYTFNHWTESVLAYKTKVQYRLKESEDYYKFLDRIGYAADSLYIPKIKNIIDRYECLRSSNVVLLE